MIAAILCFKCKSWKKRTREGAGNIDDDKTSAYGIRLGILSQSAPRSLLNHPESIDPNADIKTQSSNIPYNLKRELPRSSFKILELLGSGNFGTVHKGELIEGENVRSKTTVAIKSVLTGTETELSNFLLEIKIMSHVNPHINIVSMIGACTSELEQNNQLWLLLEYCQFGNLKMFLHENKHKLLSSTCKEQMNSRCLILWCHDVAKGMQYLAKHHIMHGDLAARNILVAQNPLTSAYPLAKVADFGMSKTFYDNLIYEKNSRKLVPWKWMAYEYLTRDFFTLTSDVWSFQVLVWEIFSFGRLPYGQQGYKEVLDQLQKGWRLQCPKEINPISSWSPKTIYNKLATVCFVSDPIARAHFSQVVEIIESGLSREDQTRYKAMVEKNTTSCANRYLVK